MLLLEEEFRGRVSTRSCRNVGRLRCRSWETASCAATEFEFHDQPANLALQNRRPVEPIIQLIDRPSDDLIGLVGQSYLQRPFRPPRL